MPQYSTVSYSPLAAIISSGHLSWPLITSPYITVISRQNLAVFINQNTQRTKHKALRSTVVRDRPLKR